MSAVTRQAASALNANKSGSDGCRSNKRYLVSKGVEDKRLIAIGRGEANPVIMCPDTMKRDDLIKCLEPNRRVEVEQIVIELSH